jgi:hypothetical protein
MVYSLLCRRGRQRTIRYSFPHNAILTTRLHHVYLTNGTLKMITLMFCSVPSACSGSTQATETRQCLITWDTIKGRHILQEAKKYHLGAIKRPRWQLRKCNSKHPLCNKKHLGFLHMRFHVFCSTLASTDELWAIFRGPTKGIILKEISVIWREYEKLQSPLPATSNDLRKRLRVRQTFCI